MLSSSILRMSQSIQDYRPASKKTYRLGVLPGEGIGPEVVAAALRVLQCLTAAYPDWRFEIQTGGAMGTQTLATEGTALPESVIAFCQNTFEAGGAVFCGPGGGRFVYALRAHFDLYCKLTPLQPQPALQDTGILRPERVRQTDIIAVRENISGLYFGDWGYQAETEQAFHQVIYRRQEIDRVLKVAAALASQRRGQVCLVTKPCGIPAISELWAERARALIQSPLVLRILEIDNACYQLIANAQDFDVLVSPNMFGDVLADCGALLLGSRGMSFSGNFGPPDRAVYQTGHGAAYDLAGQDRANPLGQILSLAMMLRESYGWSQGAERIETAVAATLAQGYRTADIAAPGSQILGTSALTDKICQYLLHSGV